MDFQSMMNQAAMGGGGGGSGAGAGGDTPQHDNAETIYISSLALLKVGANTQTEPKGGRDRWRLGTPRGSSTLTSPCALAPPFP